MATKPPVVLGKTSCNLVVNAADSLSNDFMSAYFNTRWYGSCFFAALAMTYALCSHIDIFTGTLITNFVGPLGLASDISTIFMERVLEHHPLGQRSLGCVWILSFALLRTIAEQLDVAFEILDLVDKYWDVSFLTLFTKFKLVTC